jgi:hypothetical protein
MASTDIDAWMSRYEFDPDVVTVAAVTGVTILVDTVGAWALSATVGVGVRPFALLVVLTTMAVGATARYGLAVGLLGSGALLSDWTGGVISAVAAFAAAAVYSRLWYGRAETNGWLRPLVRYEVAAVLATLTLAATSAWLADVLGAAVFSTVLARSLTANLPLAVLGAPVGWLLADLGAGRRWRTATRGLSSTGRLLVAGVLVAWTVGGYLSSFLFQATSLVPIELFGRRLGTAAETVVVLGGPQGRNVVFLVGATAIVVLFVILRRE